MPLFVWVTGLNGTEAQIWNDTVTSEASVKDKKVLFRKEISDLAAENGLSVLMKMWPCPQKDD